MTGPPAAPPPSSRTSLCLSFLSYKARTQWRLPPRLLTPSRPPHHGEEEEAPQGSRFPPTPRMQCRASPLECPHHTAQPPELPPLGRPSAPSAALEAGAAPPLRWEHACVPLPWRTGRRSRCEQLCGGEGGAGPRDGARVLTAAAGPTLGANPPPSPRGWPSPARARSGAGLHGRGGRERGRAAARPP